MTDYNIYDFLNDNDKLRIQIDIPKKLVNVLDDYVSFKKVSNRKKLIEMLIIKFILEKEKDLY